MGETGGEPPLTRQLRIPGQQVSIQGRRISPERAPACPVRCGIVVCGMDPLGAGPQDRWAEARAREIGDSSLALAGSVLARTMRERRVRCSDVSEAAGAPPQEPPVRGPATRQSASRARSILLGRPRPRLAVGVPRPQTWLQPRTERCSSRNANLMRATSVRANNCRDSERGAGVLRHGTLLPSGRVSILEESMKHRTGEGIWELRTLLAQHVACPGVLITVGAVSAAAERLG